MDAERLCCIALEIVVTLFGEKLLNKQLPPDRFSPLRRILKLACG